MSKKADTYTVTQASMVLGVSPKRIRQMIAEGKLTAHSESPVTITQTQVLALKATREKSGAVVRTPNPSKPEANADLLAQISELINQSSETNRRAIELVQESAQRNEQNLIGQVNELKAEIERLRARKWYKKG
ncbi:MAG: hypothetical protein WCH42_07920 [Actinomycetes bacterium]